MNDTIKVGDRVRGKATGRKYLVLAIYEDMAWILHEETDLTSSVGFQYLTRIEPEKVALTPKYVVAQRLRTSPLRLNITADNIYVVKGPVVGYELESGGWLPESLLFPIPEPCPTCKGSGKSEGVT
jgi:hypothetical protein